jgi:hypothetical protein
LFAIDLPACAWPAPEAVASYFGRAGEENRFAQEDRELGLDRILSYHIPGQELAVVVGLSLWNIRLVKGFELAPPPMLRVVPSERRAVLDERAEQNWPRDPVIIAALSELDWPELLSTRPGWKWDEDKGELSCEQGRPLGLTSVRPVEQANGRSSIILRRPLGGCMECASRGHCLRSAKEEAAKHVELLVPTPMAVKLRERLGLLRGKIAGKLTDLKQTEEKPGPLAVGESLFLPARARQVFEACFLGASLQVNVELPPPGPPQPHLLARDVADRQRRRKTWRQNVERYALPEGARVQLVATGLPAIRRLLGESQPAKAEPRLRSGSPRAVS